MTEANQDFSPVAHIVDKNGAAIILKNNSPKYLLMEFSRFADEESADDDSVESISKRILAKNRRAFEELAK